ncbi:hypothetical protein WISP_146032 [Willisornis vidua]|uniref:Uncharacterized protein n=1 Tax=Willisornis vidua TaxID=1566151 RepID=A0ABQ9CQ74_9PASS|nr:hypothetical protein WISP_146032 [Willisornis vidua]
MLQEGFTPALHPSRFALKTEDSSTPKVPFSALDDSWFDNFVLCSGTVTRKSRGRNGNSQTPRCRHGGV